MILFENHYLWTKTHAVVFKRFDVWSNITSFSKRSLRPPIIIFETKTIIVVKNQYVLLKALIFWNYMICPSLSQCNISRFTSRHANSAAQYAVARLECQRLRWIAFKGAPSSNVARGHKYTPTKMRLPMSCTTRRGATVRALLSVSYHILASVLCAVGDEAPQPLELLRRCPSSSSSSATAATIDATKSIGADDTRRITIDATKSRKQRQERPSRKQRQSALEQKWLRTNVC